MGAGLWMRVSSDFESLCDPRKATFAGFLLSGHGLSARGHGLSGHTGDSKRIPRIETRMTNEIEGQPSPVTAAQPPAVPQTVEILTKKELAARLKVTARTIENWQRRGVVPFVKVQKVVLFLWSDVIEHLRANFRVCRRGTGER